MNKVCFFTVVSRNYLPYAQALMESVARHAPDAERVVILCEPKSEREPTDDNCQLVSAQQIGIPDLSNMALRYTIVELNTAVKPFVFNYLIRERGYEKAIFFDPDIYVYSPLDEMLADLDRHDILLTPHLQAPIGDECPPTETDILQSGAYNLGFIAMRRGEVAEWFVNWWARRLTTLCIIDKPRGLFLDQKWVDLVPGMFPGVKVVRHPGWNVAYWNLRNRRLAISGAGFTVNDVPLVFFHFSGFRGGDYGLSAHENPYSNRPLPADLQGLLNQYKKRLEKHDSGALGETPGYCYLEDGTHLPDIAKQALRSVCAERGIPIPDERDQIFTLLNEKIEQVGPDKPLLSRLELYVYSIRADIQALFPGVPYTQQKRFARWFVQAAPREYGLSEAWLSELYETARVDAETTKASPIATHILGIFDRSPRLRRSVRRLVPRNWRQRLRYWMLRVNR